MLSNLAPCDERPFVVLLVFVSLSFKVSNDSHVNTEQKEVLCSCPRMKTLKEMVAANVLSVKVLELGNFLHVRVPPGIEFLVIFDFFAP